MSLLSKDYVSCPDVCWQLTTNQSIHFSLSVIILNENSMADIDDAVTKCICLSSLWIHYCCLCCSVRRECSASISKIVSNDISTHSIVQADF